MAWFKIVAAVNDGQVTLSPEMYNVSPVINAQATAAAQLAQAKFTNKLFINVPGTVNDLQTLERYVLRSNQTDCPQPGELDLATLITVAELAVELKIPGVADLFTSSISRVLGYGIDSGDSGDVKDYPWVNLCHLAKKIMDEKFFNNIAWWFLNAARATRSQKGALWAFQIGRTVYEDTGYPRLWTYGLYLCVVWGAFTHSNAPTLSSTMASAVDLNQKTLATLTGGLAIPQLCDVHDPQACVGEGARRRCVDHWHAVWRKAHHVANDRADKEYEGTNIGGPSRDVLRMLHLVSGALQDITHIEPFRLVSPACDLSRLHASNGWVLEQQSVVRSIITHLAFESIFSLRTEDL